MRQYWIFALNSLLNIVFCAVDGAFGNGISIDAIVVMGSFTIIQSIGTQVLVIGGHAYKILQRYEKSCCLLAAAAGILVGGVCIICAHPITFVFELTDTQREMLKQAVICYGFWCPIEAVGRYLQRFIMYGCYNKLILISNFLTYILMISTDWLAIQMGWGVNGLISATGITWLIYVVILLVATKFIRQSDKITFGKLKTAFLKGKDVALGGIIARSANLCLGHYASTMGMEQYAIHSVALSIVTLAEEFRDAECDYVIVKLKNRNKHKGNKAKRVFRQCAIPSFILTTGSALVLTLVMHGKVDLLDALYGVAIYCMPMLLYPVYDLLQQFAFSRGKTHYAAFNSGICAFWRIGAIWVISIIIPINIWALGFIYVLDYASRMLSYFILLKRDANRRKMTAYTESAECDR